MKIIRKIRLFLFILCAFLTCNESLAGIKEGREYYIKNNFHNAYLEYKKEFMEKKSAEAAFRMAFMRFEGITGEYIDYYDLTLEEKKKLGLEPGEILDDNIIEEYGSYIKFFLEYSWKHGTESEGQHYKELSKIFHKFLYNKEIEEEEFNKDIKFLKKLDKKGNIFSTCILGMIYSREYFLDGAETSVRRFGTSSKPVHLEDQKKSQEKYLIKVAESNEIILTLAETGEYLIYWKKKPDKEKGIKYLEKSVSIYNTEITNGQYYLGWALADVKNISPKYIDFDRSYNLMTKASLRNSDAAEYLALLYSGITPYLNTNLIENKLNPLDLMGLTFLGYSPRNTLSDYDINKITTLKDLVNYPIQENQYIASHFFRDCFNMDKENPYCRLGTVVHFDIYNEFLQSTFKLHDDDSLSHEDIIEYQIKIIKDGKNNGLSEYEILYLTTLLTESYLDDWSVAGVTLNEYKIKTKRNIKNLEKCIKLAKDKHLNNNCRLLLSEIYLLTGWGTEEEFNVVLSDFDKGLKITKDLINDKTVAINIRTQAFLNLFLKHSVVYKASASEIEKYPDFFSNDGSPDPKRGLNESLNLIKKKINVPIVYSFGSLFYKPGTKMNKKVGIDPDHKKRLEVLKKGYEFCIKDKKMYKPIHRLFTYYSYSCSSLARQLEKIYSRGWGVTKDPIASLTWLIRMNKWSEYLEIPVHEDLKLKTEFIINTKHLNEAKILAQTDKVNFTTSYIESKREIQKKEGKKKIYPPSSALIKRVKIKLKETGYNIKSDNDVLDDKTIEAINNFTDYKIPENEEQWLELLENLTSSIKVASLEPSFIKLRKKKEAANFIYSGDWGSGFIVDKNHIITNEHVINDPKTQQKCDQIRLDNKNKLKIIDVSKQDDIAVLKSKNEFSNYVILREEKPKKGENIYVNGFGARNDDEDISTPSQFEPGSISSLMGLNSDSKTFQMNANIQPGHSGGPVFDKKGYLIGIVQSSIRLRNYHDKYDAIPQNINFAIKSYVLKYYLEKNNINYLNEVPETIVDSSQIASFADKVTVRISCYIKE